MQNKCLYRILLFYIKKNRHSKKTKLLKQIILKLIGIYGFSWTLIVRFLVKLLTRVFDDWRCLESKLAQTHVALTGPTSTAADDD